jgi:hypothetical protein
VLETEGLRAPYRKVFCAPLRGEGRQKEIHEKAPFGVNFSHMMIYTSGRGSFIPKFLLPLMDHRVQLLVDPMPNDPFLESLKFLSEIVLFVIVQ